MTSQREFGAGAVEAPGPMRATSRARVPGLRVSVATVVSAFLLALGMPANALHPISSKLDFVGVYPVYPDIEYGSGARAQAIRRGEYLARLGDCIACHTRAEAGAAPFAGGLPIPTPFGTFYTPNITPDEKTGIGRWSEEDFVRAMRDGILADGSNAFPAFPYVFFNRVREQDLKDLWAYLRAVPAVERPNQGDTLPFPLNVRFAQYGWKILFFYPDRGTFEADPSRSASWNRGAYLVEGLGHCSMCHTPLNVLGAPKGEYYLSGAFIDGYWAPDITRRGLASASRFQVADVFDEGRLINRAGPVRGPMADAIHDSLRYLTDADRLAIAEYLKSVITRDPRNVTKLAAAQPPLKLGAQVYANVCIACHLDGQVGAPSIHDESNWERRVSQRSLSLLYRHAIGGYNKMPPKGACITCTNEDVRAAVDYLVYRALDESRWRELKSPPPSERDISTSIGVGAGVYKQACAACHEDGTFGAPVLGDKARWAPILQKNFDVLLRNSLHGTGNMPPKGGCVECTNSEIIAAVKYMAQQSQAGRDYSLW